MHHRANDPNRRAARGPRAGHGGSGRQYQQPTRPGPSGHEGAVIAKLAWHRGASPMTIIDSQVHVYEANTPKRPWHSVPNWPDHVTGDEMVAAMNKVASSAPTLLWWCDMYRYDASYGVQVQRPPPGQLAIVKLQRVVVDPIGLKGTDCIETPGAVGIRIMMT